MTLAEKGCKVAINYHSSENAARLLCERINQMYDPVHGNMAILAKADCSSSQDVQNMFSQCIKAFGGLDILVNNAGVVRDGITARMSDDDFSKVLDVNLKGTFYCSKAAITGTMLKQRAGRIINVSSIVGQVKFER